MIAATARFGIKDSGSEFEAFEMDVAARDAQELEAVADGCHLHLVSRPHGLNSLADTKSGTARAG